MPFETDPNWRRAYRREHRRGPTQAELDGSAAANRARQHEETRKREAPFLPTTDTPTRMGAPPPRTSRIPLTGIFPSRPRKPKRERAPFGIIDVRGPEPVVASGDTHTERE